MVREYWQENLTGVTPKRVLLSEQKKLQTKGHQKKHGSYAALFIDGFPSYRAIIVGYVCPCPILVNSMAIN